MTAYLDRLRSQPSLRARPRSRFEPALPGAEPPWERPAPGATLPPVEIDDQVRTRPGEALGHATLPAGPAARPPAGPAARPPAGPAVPLAGPAVRPAAPVNPLAAPAVPAGGQPDAAAAPPRSSQGPGQPPGSSRSASAPARPEPPPAPVPARPRGAPGDLPPSPGPGQPSAVIRPASPARQRPEKRAEAASGLVRLMAQDGGLSHRGEHRSAPPGDPAAPASSGPGSMGSAPGDRSAAGPAVRAAGGRRFDASEEPDGHSGPDQPAPPMDRARVTARTPRWEAAETAVPYHRRWRAPGDRAGTAEPAVASDRGAALRPGSPGTGRRAPAAAGPDEVTVTIGRVEVRVGPPASPAGVTPRGSGARPSRPQPRRLDDYLRARASGRVG